MPEPADRDVDSSEPESSADGDRESAARRPDVDRSVGGRPDVDRSVGGRPDAEALLAEVDGPLLLFDGVCNLCNSLVQFVLERDPDGEFAFASLQSDAGQALLERFGLPTDDFDTFVMVEGDECYTKSEAGLRVLRRLGLPWSLLYPGVVLPRAVRDRVYDAVAGRRYGWFGRSDSCTRPPEDVSDRFLG